MSFCPTFRAKSSVPFSQFQSFSVNLVDFALILLEALVSFHQLSVNFSQLKSVLVSFNQGCTRQKHRNLYRQEGGAKQHPKPLAPGASTKSLGPATTQNLVVKFDGEICGGVLVENACDDFPQQMKLKNLLPNFVGSSPPILPKTSPTSLWKSLVLKSQF